MDMPIFILWKMFLYLQTQKELPLINFVFTPHLQGIYDVSYEQERLYS
jgi:hypothetical protein